MESYISQLAALPPLSQPHLIFILMGIVFAAGFVTSAFGIGEEFLPPSLYSSSPPKFAIGLLAPLALWMSATGVRQYWRKWDMRHIRVLLPSSLVGVWVGTYLLAEISAALVTRTVGAWLSYSASFSYWLSIAPIGAIASVPPPGREWDSGSAPASPAPWLMPEESSFLSNLLPHSRTKEIFVGTTVFLFTVQASLKVGTYFYFRILNIPTLLLSGILIPALMAGSLTGKWFNQRISHELFIRLISVFVAAMGSVCCSFSRRIVISPLRQATP